MNGSNPAIDRGSVRTRQESPLFIADSVILGPQHVDLLARDGTTPKVIGILFPLLLLALAIWGVRSFLRDRHRRFRFSFQYVNESIAAST